MSAPGQVTQFDSSTVMLRALAMTLHGRELRALGAPEHVRWIAEALEAVLPVRGRKFVYQKGGWFEATRPGRMRLLDAEAVARWMTGLYPKRKYPGAIVGSSNGAAVHLAAALGIPWLPQNWLVLVRAKGLDPDEPRHAVEAALHPAKLLLDANPDLKIHQMVDPSQDRLMSREALYFRVKRTRLGKEYENFLIESLEPGGTILLLECNESWPTTQVGERHYFQFGGKGGLTPAEYYEGSEKVRRFLEREGASRRIWNPPVPDRERPEAEWGFDPELRTDVERFAGEHGFKVERIVFRDPEDLSPLVSDLYSWWFERNGGLETRRLGVESFFLVSPLWALETRTVPFWITFNAEESAKSVERYLDRRMPFDEIYLVPFSHGIRSPGIASPERWRRILNRAVLRGRFFGTRIDRYPSSIATMVRVRPDLDRLVPRGNPPPLATLSDVHEFLQGNREKYDVSWVKAPEPGLRSA